MRPHFHGQWCEAQMPTLYAYVLYTVPGGVITFPIIHVPEGQRWLIRGWGVKNLTCTSVGTIFHAILNQINNVASENVPMSTLHSDQDPVALLAAASHMCDDINPFIVEGGNDLECEITQGWSEEDTVKFIVWYEQLDQIDAQPVEVSAVGE